MEAFLYSLINNFGYIGIFLLGVFAAAALFFPTAVYLIIFLIAPAFNPFLLGLFAGVGATIGEMNGYLIGRGGEHFLLKKHEKRIKKMERHFEKHHSWLIVFIFTAIPFPFNVVGLFCGAIRYPLKSFFFAVLPGKIVKYWIISFAGYYATHWVLNLFKW